ncbi:ribosome-binding protein MDM38 [Kluyveromyces lactis]|uniref:KLLA0B11748p n=1 Tax=Kluyveromyces lactis (strain ATCC 8585 / CBS 2359 / DSM 70799 / NBRC 1267 / NRRL Y-1140 / WM37) TaxID=284590 RepID=Q6CVI7_KLULA|nr:uncharacterized protein KLLA0_B11748g [Kluyveromyces lactis]CAH02445.1 KLLA0B11748p [Kluyveromyces lactis]|eukprot:XP_452052.1 uncharacterized protein KLLA0_B11748g [Kluyveromyces lactis]
MFRRVVTPVKPGYGILRNNAGLRVPVLPVPAHVTMIAGGKRFASSNSNSETGTVTNTAAATTDKASTGELVDASKAPATKPVAAKKEKKPPLWDRIKHELTHYVNGTKLLGYEIKVSTKLLVKFVQGYELSRREKNQLKRTMGDIFRLVPFSAFLIIPFAELLLPVALKIFPNLLPSTYESGKEKKIKRTKLNEIRAKTSNFLQETLEESSLINYKSLESTEKKKQFLNFFKKLNSTKDGKENLFTHEEILNVAKMFKNDTVLDNLSRPQLIAMAKYMSLRPFGNDNMLRYQIRFNLKHIIEDDKTIDYEGAASLSDEELYQACVSRGIKTFGVSKDELLENLKVWLDLRLRHQVPSVLLVLSSAYTFGGIPKEQKVDAYSTASIEAEVEDTKFNNLLDFYYDGILQVLSSIPDPVYNVTKLDVSESKEPSSSTAAAAKAEPKEEPSITKLASEALATNASAASAAANVVSNIASASPKSETETKPASAKSESSVTDQKKEAVQEPQPEQAKDEKEAVSEEAEEEEEQQKTDDNAFKLSVLKEQEELIKKEEEEAKLRSQREVIKDDINLDEKEEEIPEKASSEPAKDTKNSDEPSDGKKQ